MKMKPKMKNSKKAIIVIATVCSGVLLAGCPKPQETVVVQPQEKVIENTTIKTAPPKTVVVKPAPQTQPKTTVKTDVTVTVAPTPTAKPTPIATPIATMKPASTPRPTPKPTAKPIAQPTPKPTAKPTAAPRPIAKSDSKVDSKKLVVRAEVVATSKVPDPKTVPYKESLVFTKYKIISIQSGQYKEKEILVAQWGMKDKKLQAAARNRIGQVQTLTLEPLSGDMDSVMRNDDTSEFELEPYFAK